MNLQNAKGPVLAATSPSPNQNNLPGNNITASPEAQQLRTGTKRAAILKTFIEIGERGMNCFEAANRHHDYVLRSTISDLGKYGIRFDRKPEKVPNAFGKLTDCVRYWLSPNSVDAARSLLGQEGV